MNHHTPQQSACAALPGLARLFLLQVYLFLFLFFALQLTFFFVSAQSYRAEMQLEPVLWQLACLAACVWSLSVVVGLHTRAAWALSNAVRYCRYLVFFSAAAAIRLLSLFDDLGVRISLDYFGMNDFQQTFMVMLPAFCMLSSLQIYAWGKYCRVSVKLRSAFGQVGQPIQSERGDDARPLGIGLLHLLCGCFLVFYLVFFLSLALAARNYDNTLFVMAVLLSLPQIAMPALLLACTWKKGSKRAPLHICFAVWIALSAVWSAFLPALIHSQPFGADGGFFFFAFEFVGAYPVSRVALPTLLAALWWRLAVSPDDAVWFAGRAAARQRSEASRLRLFLCGYAAYLLLTYGAHYLYGLLASPRWPDVSLGLLTALLLVLAGWSIYCQIRERRYARPVCLTLAFSVLALLTTFIVMIFLRHGNTDSINSLIRHTLPSLLRPVAMLGGGLYLTLRDRPDQPLPLSVFKIFCLAVACMFILPRLLLAGLLLAKDGGAGLGAALLTVLGGVSTTPSYYGETNVVFSASFFFALTLLPLVFPILLRAGRAKRLSRPVFLAMLGAWLLLLYSASVAQLAQIMQSHGNPMLSSGFAIHFDIISLTLILFFIYFCSSKTFSLWAAKEPERPTEIENA